MPSSRAACAPRWVAETLAKPPAARLAQGSAREDQGKAKTDSCFFAALCAKEKRKEQQISHARRGIERADREEQTEAAAVSALGICFFFGGNGEGPPRHERQQREGDRQSDQRHEADDWPPSDEGQ